MAGDFGRVHEIKSVKTIWAIICSLVLAGTPFLRAAQQMPSPCAKQVRACCQCGGAMSCCKANSSPDSQSKPAVPAQTGNQNQLSLLTFSALIWTLPAHPANSISSLSTTLSMAADTPLFARNCARLI